MSSTEQSWDHKLAYEVFGLKPSQKQLVIALAGNPNTGKSTIFNALTGLRQHTGNWPGKTVLRAEGTFVHKNKKVLLVDLPGAYSLLPTSADEQVTRDFICLSHPDAIIVVADATCLERNLNLILQVIEISPKVVVCVNLMDEASRRKIRVNIKALSRELGVPCVPTTARNGVGLEKLKNTILDIATGIIATTPRKVTYEPHVNEAAARLQAHISPFLPGWVNHRWIALRLLEGDMSIIKAICKQMNEQTQNIVSMEGTAAWTP